MNYYNPYFYSIPYSMTPAKVGLFSRLFGGGKLTFGSIINGTQKVLGFANQAIPVVRQTTPLIKNAKTMFKVMNEFKRNDNNKNNTRINNNSTNSRTNNDYYKKTNNIETSDNSDEINNVSNTNNNDGYPTFFI